MAYVVHNFEQGDILYANQLNEMDAQIALNEENISSGISSDMLAETYSANKTYSVGDYVVYNNDLYICISEITAPEGWNLEHWQVSNLGDGISDAKNAVDAIEGCVDALELTSTVSGTALEINTVAGTPKNTYVEFEWTQGDITNVSPENPVYINTAENCAITVNANSITQDFTNTVGEAGIGKGTWDAINGTITVVQKAVVVTADMVVSLAWHSGSKYAAVLNFGTSVYAGGGGVLACSHYKISSGSSGNIRFVNGTTYLYDDRFTNDLAAVKSYVASLNMVVVFAIETPQQYSVEPKQIAFVDGNNTISVDIGMMTVEYKIDLKDYIDSSVDAVSEVANLANEKAGIALVHTDSLQNNVNGINENLYKYRTITGSNTGTGTATTSDNIHWGMFLNIDPLVMECWNLILTPACSSSAEGTYTATRWKNSTGNALTSGEVLTVVESKTANKGESVTFDNVGLGEFISIKFSNGHTQRTTDPGAEAAHIGHIDPATGVFTYYSGYLSGAFSIVLYKPIVGDCMTLFGKRITLIGDSITEKNGRANVNHGMWLERWTGCIIQNLGVGSTGFARTPGSTNYKTRIPQVNADADIIGVAASFNDMTYTLGTPSDTASDDTICGYVNEFFDTILGLYPTKRIVCYSEGPWYNYHPGITSSDNYMAALKIICENKGIVWDDGLYRGCALRPWIQANCEVYYLGESGQYEGVVDNVHPNSAGQEVIARYLEKLFEKVVD